MTPKPRTTRTTEMTTYGSMTLGDLEQFIDGCRNEGWTSEATVTVSRTTPDRPGESSATSLRVSETR